MGKLKIKQQRGITLISLIVTIIVLLILATVSIKLLIDNGIIGHAQEATNKYTVAQEKEMISLAYSDYKMAKLENPDNAVFDVKDAQEDGDELSGWTITFDKTGNRYTLSPEGSIKEKPKTDNEKLIERYALGENGEIRLYKEIYNGTEFIGNNVIPDAKTKLINPVLTDEVDDENCTGLFFRYENEEYRLVVDNTTDGRCKSVELVYTSQGMEGQKVKYSYDGTPENEKDWTILYDYGDTVEIISPETMGDLKLGSKDEEAQTPGDIDKDGAANTDIDKAIYSYNNAISKLNRYCASLITNPDKISVRSAGSNPQNPNAESGMYTSEDLSKWCEGRYNGIAKGADANYKQDYARMAYNGTSDKGLFWIASRRISDKINEKIFYIRNAADGMYVTWGYLGKVDENKAYGESMIQVNKVCPIVKISKDSIKMAE